jgi:hypothetical protein
MSCVFDLRNILQLFGFLARCENVLVFGLPNSSKTHLLCAPNCQLNHYLRNIPDHFDLIEPNTYFENRPFHSGCIGYFLNSFHKAFKF